MAAETRGNGRFGKVLTFLVCILLVVVVGIYLLFGYNRFTLSITPLGDTEILMDYGSVYQEQGAVACFAGSQFWQDGFAPDSEIHIDGTVDTTTTGTYTVLYSTNYRWWTAQAQRTVHVVDRVAPTLSLLGEEEVYVLPGEEYVEPGFTASDDYDGDLTAQVVCTAEDGCITYEVRDAAGNIAEATRTVHYDDAVPPEITLTGGDTIEVYAGIPYADPGFTAWDNCDGDLTASVMAEGDIHRYFTGTYTRTYTVTDSFGNTTTVQRQVNVVPQPIPEEISPEGKVIYLTFDDGPGPYTRELLEVLDKYDVKATFFVVCNQYSDVIGEIAEAGHAVGIHTACHSYRTIYANEEAYFADLDKVQQLIYAETGAETTLLRFPGGSSNTVSRFNKGIMTRLTQAVQAAGFQYFDWNVDSNDAGGAETASEVYQNVISGVRNRRVSIVLQHDIKGFSVDAVERIIIWGLENGYTFRALDETSPCFHHEVNN